jgi:phosphatidate cytidylyltransferase
VLSLRLVIAHAILIPVLCVTAADYYWSAEARGAWLYPLGALLFLVAAVELHQMLSVACSGLNTRCLLSAAALPILALAWPLYRRLWGHEPVAQPHEWFYYSSAGLFAALALLLAVEMARFDQPRGDAVRRVAAAMLVLVYLMVPLTFLIATRWHQENTTGMLALVYLVFVVKISDTGAYFIGSNFGRRKLAPRLSPKKTVEGAVGGLLFAGLAAALAYGLIRPLLCEAANPTTLAGYCRWTVVGVLLGAVAIVGDLADSLLKRDVGRKDSGDWLPGLGGALDLLDSLLLAAPVNFALWYGGWIST